MKKELIKKLYLKEVVTILLFIVLISIYLKIPFSTIDVLTNDIEVSNKIQTEISIYQNKDIDFSYGFKTAFYNTLPLTQIIEYKKQSFINDVAKFYNNGNDVPVEVKDILGSTHLLNSLRVLIKDGNNYQYNFIQFLGVISVVSSLLLIYFIVKYKKPSLLNWFFFILTLFYFTNLIFYELKVKTEKLTEETLKELYINNKIK